jgi:predicted P-loop ATPase
MELESLKLPKGKNEEKKISIFPNKFTEAEDYLSTRYEFRRNVVSLQIEYRDTYTETYRELNENSLFRELQKVGKSISMNNLIALLKSDFVADFDPILTYFSKLKWDGRDHISKLASYVKARDNEEWIKHFKKHLVRTVACSLIPDYYNKQALIIIDPKQDSGKSTFCRFLCPPALSDYIAEDVSVDKDSRILLAKNLIINLDELAILSKRDIAQLKSFISKDKINERLPYDRKNTVLPRRASFVGSSNSLEILNDETGTVRWLCFDIISINWSYKAEIDINQVWAEAYHLFQTGFKYNLTKEELLTNEERNRRFQKLTIERELLQKLFDPDNERNPNNFMTATDVMLKIKDLSNVGNHITKENTGRALKQLNYPEGRDTHSRYGYFITQKIFTDVNTPL